MHMEAHLLFVKLKYNVEKIQAPDTASSQNYYFCSLKYVQIPYVIPEDLPFCTIVHWNCKIMYQYHLEWANTCYENKQLNVHTCNSSYFATKRLFAGSKGGNFNIHIWVLFGYFIC